MHQFLIVLAKAKPRVWRRIQVPIGYSFWDLHVAIQDAMGWFDYHLHEFEVRRSKRGPIQRFGIAGDELIDARPCEPDWRVAISDHVWAGMTPIQYLYDFGDAWHHMITYEGQVAAAAGAKYPRCIDGARRCPPEDCGGVYGYADFLDAIANPKHPVHPTLLEWAGGKFDPNDFKPQAVTFDNPRKRWKRAFENERAV